MLRPTAPYPSDLTWLRFFVHMLVLNEVLVIVGALSMHAVETMDSKLIHPLGLPYHFVWMHCVGLTALVINGAGMILVTRRGWRAMPNATERFARLGLYKGLPNKIKWQILFTSLVSVPLAAWAAQQGFLLLQATPWGAHLPQAVPPYKIAVFNTAYGAVVTYVYEYFRDRAVVSEMRERTAQKLSAQAQLNLLRSQLDPHMLFNTLSNLYELIDDSPTQARAMLAHLIGFLRATLAGSRVTQHALNEEFKLASDYLSLMQIRMGQRLQTSMTLPTSLSKTEVPAMLLQPLVENAIKHGLETRKEGGLLTVSATSQAGELVLCVANTGLNGQHAPDPLTLPPTRGSGFGLQYVQERLRALYGDAARIDFQYLRDQNLTQVTVRMPHLLLQAAT